MAAKPGKIINVDFGEKRRKPPGDFWGFMHHRHYLLVMTLVMVGVQVLFFALLGPGWITHSMFAPTTVVVGVLLAIWSRKALMKWAVNAMYKQAMRDKAGPRDDDQRTYH